MDDVVDALLRDPGVAVVDFGIERRKRIEPECGHELRLVPPAPRLERLPVPVDLQQQVAGGAGHPDSVLDREYVVYGAHQGVSQLAQE